MNLSNSDTLYRIANGRYNLGTIAEEDLLQMQLSYLNAVTDSKTADMNLRDKEISYGRFLAIIRMSGLNSYFLILSLICR